MHWERRRPRRSPSSMRCSRGRGCRWNEPPAGVAAAGCAAVSAPSENALEPRIKHLEITLMRNVDKVSFPYRSSTHLNLLHVISESGSWAKHGLDVNYDFGISKTDAHRAVTSGEVEFVGGNHISTYGHRARGDKWVYLGQTLNRVDPKLVVRPDSGINGIGDLRGKRIGTRGHHPGLNDWLLLKQRGLDVDREDIELTREVPGS